MSKNQKNLLRIVVATLLLITFSILVNTLSVSANCALLLYLLAYCIVAYDVIIKAIRNAINGKVFDENFLMTIATVGAFAIEQYFDAVVVMLLYQIGELFQKYAVGKTRKSIANLMDIRPQTATLVDENGNEQQIEPNQIQVGQVFVVKSGEKIAVDGTVVQGSCTLDTCSITGESLPQQVEVGNSVISGCINTNGVIFVKATCLYQDSTVSQILDLLENATNKKSKSEQFITKFSRYYTPIVVALAVVIATIVPIIAGNFVTWIRRAMMFLFVSCPCALVISVPLSFFCGIASASKNGILIKGCNCLETLSKVDCFAFDKTGTLTKGNFAIVNVCPLEDKAKIMELAQIAEQYSNHPIAKVICQDKSNFTPANVQEIAGCGIVATTNNSTILCGNEKLMQKYNIKYKSCQSNTVVYVAEKDKFVGYIEIADEIKDTSKQTIDLLNKQATTVLLTGDNEKVGIRVAEMLGISNVYCQLLPQQKANIVQQLKAQNKVAFVGDGINDAPVLATADIGIAMGLKGSDIAKETADMVLMQDDPLTVVTAKRISNKTIKIVKQNIVFSLVVKFAVLLSSFFGLLDALSFGLIIAILADVGVCIVAILNAMRAMAIK